jgi:hypothetical protein
LNHISFAVPAGGLLTWTFCAPGISGRFFCARCGSAAPILPHGKSTMKAELVTHAELERRRARRDYMRRYRARGGKPEGLRPYITTTVVPRAVAEEREAVLAAPRTPDQLLLGDPLPGRSALDRKKAMLRKPSIWR